jgi:hypothetical protein
MYVEKENELERGSVPLKRTLDAMSKMKQTAAPVDGMLLVACRADVIRRVHTPCYTADHYHNTEQVFLGRTGTL